MNDNLAITKKGSGIVLIFYGIGIFSFAFGFLTNNLPYYGTVCIGFVLIGVLIAFMIAFKPVGWNGLSKEKSA